MSHTPAERVLKSIHLLRCHKNPESSTYKPYACGSGFSRASNLNTFEHSGGVRDLKTKIQLIHLISELTGFFSFNYTFSTPIPVWWSFRSCFSRVSLATFSMDTARVSVLMYSMKLSTAAETSSSPS